MVVTGRRRAAPRENKEGAGIGVSSRHWVWDGLAASPGAGQGHRPRPTGQGQSRNLGEQESKRGKRERGSMSEVQKAR